MNIDNIGGKYVRDQAFMEPVSNGYSDIESNVTFKKKSVKKSSYQHFVFMGILATYTAAFWGARHMLGKEALKSVSDLQAMSLHQELEEMSMNLDLETNLKAKYSPSKKPKNKTKYTYNKKYGKKTKKDGGSSVFAEFFAGIIMIAFALPMIWMNERKQVKMDKINGLGREEARTINIDEPKEEELYALAHCSGVVTTSIPVVDSTFGLEEDNSVKVRRTVEVYQWVEHREEEEQEEGDPIVHYRYEK